MNTYIKLPVIICVIVEASGNFFGSAVAQIVNCNSRSIETTLQSMLARKYGPPPIAEIQAIASGMKGTIAQVQINDIQTLEPFPDGMMCAATATIRRQDTGQSFEVSAKFRIVSQFDQTRIHIESTTP